MADPHRSDVRPARAARTSSAGAPRRGRRPGRRSPPPTSARSTRCCSPTTTTPTTSTTPVGPCCPSPVSCSRRRWRDTARRRTRVGLEPGRPRGWRRPAGRRSRSRRHRAGTGHRCSRPIVGDVIGFALQWEGQEHGALWISGDTVLYDGVRQVAERLRRRHGHRAPGRRAVPDHRPGPVHDDRPGRHRAVPPGASSHRRSRCTTRAGRTSSRAADPSSDELATAPDDIRGSIRLGADRPRDRGRGLTGSHAAPPPNHSSEVPGLQPFPYHHRSAVGRRGHCDPGGHVSGRPRPPRLPARARRLRLWRRQHRGQLDRGVGQPLRAHRVVRVGRRRRAHPGRPVHALLGRGRGGHRPDGWPADAGRGRDRAGRLQPRPRRHGQPRAARRGGRPRLREHAALDARVPVDGLARPAGWSAPRTSLRPTRSCRRWSRSAGASVPAWAASSSPSPVPRWQPPPRPASPRSAPRWRWGPAGSRWPPSRSPGRASRSSSRSGPVCGPSSPPRRSPCRSCWSS